MSEVASCLCVQHSRAAVPSGLLVPSLTVYRTFFLIQHPPSRYPANVTDWTPRANHAISIRSAYAINTKLPSSARRMTRLGLQRRHDLLNYITVLL